jgi:hypothetical protein
MPARAIRSLPSRRSGAASPHVAIVGWPTSSRELGSWSVVRCPMGAVRSRSGVAYLQAAVGLDESDALASRAEPS